MLHETNKFSSNVYKSNNNVGGIIYVGHRLQAAKGTKQPSADSAGKIIYYAKYGKVSDSIQHMTELLNVRYQIQKTGLYNIETWAKKLKDKGYFGAPLSTYTNALKYHYNNVSKIV
jgi:hypothetical protein